MISSLRNCLRIWAYLILIGTLGYVENNRFSSLMISILLGTLVLYLHYTYTYNLDYA